MRLQFFLPETEPLIKETFGSVLRFEDEAFWEYNSPYSRAVSFATNLPALAMIEYGPDQNYGLTTSQTESYFYQHLFYLTGLEPGSTYHYRIKIKGSDGQFMVSEDHIFTTAVLSPDLIRIPQDLADKSLPYKLTVANAKYLLTEDVSAPNGGIVIKASNVELDLGGHTIVYDNEFNPIANESNNLYYEIKYNEDFTFGIRSGLWNLYKQNIFNGSIIQGKYGGSGIYGYGYNPVMITHVAGQEIAGVTVDFYGDNINGIDIDSEAYAHHNVVYDRGSKIDNRHLQMRAIDVITGTAGVIAYNSVRRCRQTGIAGGQECYGNEVYGDSFSTNSYLLDYSSDSLSTGNKIFGLGYNPIGIGGGKTANATARNNFIYVHAYAPSQRDQEYDRLSSAAGFRWQIYFDDQFTGTSWDNNVFADNVVVAKAWPGAANVRALWVSQNRYAKGNRVENNIVKVEAMSDDISSQESISCFTCIDVNSMDEILYDPANIDKFVPTSEVLFTDNHFITNMSFLVLGTGYATGANIYLYRNKFEKISSFESHYIPLRLGWWYYSTLNNKIIDSIEGPGVDLSLPPRKNTNNDDCHLALDIGISSQRAYLDAATGLPLADRTISWQLDGGESGTFSTDGKGEAYREWITTKNEYKPGDPESQEISRIQNTTVIFTAAGYEPVTKNISELQGMGPPILFFEGTGVSLSGKVKSNNPTKPLTIRLMKDGKTIAYEKTIAVPGDFAQTEQIFTFEGVAPGIYDLVITKAAHSQFSVLAIVIDNEDLDLTLDSRPEVQLMVLRCGDINGDGLINDADLTILWRAGNYNKKADEAENSRCDLDGDGLINDADLTILWLAYNYNRGAIVIEDRT
ncbi:MAG: dockerin type I domain-containing protein, partial [Clostridiales bacterium]|jgi:hypothetical protein|nr:dockerin type I domain-containing protein [Clostridiales bacterium]